MIDPQKSTLPARLVRPLVFIFFLVYFGLGLTLYYKDRLEYYITQKTYKGTDMPTGAAAFRPAETPKAPNPYGEIPVFHFRPNRHAKGELSKSITTLQDAVNKLLADMMVAAEFGAFKQRWIISNADTKALKNAPNEVWTRGQLGIELV